MEEPFIITLEHNAKQLNLQAQLLRTGYTHKFMVQVAEMEVFFEPDEEGAYRALLPPTTNENDRQNIDVALLQNIATTIEAILA